MESGFERAPPSEEGRRRRRKGSARKKDSRLRPKRTPPPTTCSRKRPLLLPGKKEVDKTPAPKHLLRPFSRFFPSPFQPFHLTFSPLDVSAAAAAAAATLLLAAASLMWGVCCTATLETKSLRPLYAAFFHEKPELYRRQDANFE